MCSISKMKEQKCPHCESTDYQVHHTGTPAFGDPVRLGVRTIDNGFREVLSKINSKAPKSNLGNKLSRS